MRPRIFRRLSREDARDKSAAQIAAQQPADLYLYSHLSWHETAAALRDEHGKRVLWYVNPFSCRDEFAPGGWVHYFADKQFALCELRDLWLRDRSGALVRFPFPVLGSPRLVNYAKLTADDAGELAGFMLGFQPDGQWFVDQTWPRIMSWMLGTVRDGDLADYSPAAYLHGLQMLLASLGWQERCVLNGWSAWDRQGWRVMYEHADKRGDEETWHTAARWALNRGSVLSVDRGFGSPETGELIDLWARGGGILELLDETAALAAWERVNHG